MTIGIAIPTHPTHVGYVYNLLEQINKSSILPNQVSISISEFSGDLLIKEYPFEVIVSKSTEPKMASQNRNIAGSKLQTDIISFMDADDIPHIRRNEFLLKSFDLGAKSVVHDYIYTGLSITHYSDELNEFNFDNTVKFVGYQSNIYKILKKTAIVCLPSYREGLPKSLCEAAACGIPIVTTATVGCTEVVKAKFNGELCKTKDHLSLATKIEKLILNPKLRVIYGKNSISYAKRNFDIKLISNKIIKIYNELLVYEK